MPRIIKIILPIFVFVLIFSVSVFFYLINKKGNNSDKTENVGKNGYEIKNQEDMGEIRAAFKNFLDEAAGAIEGSFRMMEIRDTSGNIVNLGNFTKATGLAVHPQLWKIIDKGSFNLFYCPSKKENEKGIGIMLNVQQVEDYYNKELRMLEDWEKSIIFDTQNIIYPDLNLNADYLKAQNLEFNDVSRGRFTEFKDSRGEKKSFYYEAVGDSIFMTDSSDCFKKVSNSLESL